GIQMMDRIVTEFTEEDVQALSDNVVTILKTVRNMTQPDIMALANQSVEIAVQQDLQEGEAVACQKGCGACCAQLVPVSELEIREIAMFIENLPASKRKRIRQAFNEAQARFEAAGLWEKLLHPEQLEVSERIEFSLRYFELGVYCPFLEEGACSIHPVRPVSCREYLVKSSPEHCANPRAGNIDGIAVPNRVSNALGILFEDDKNYVSAWVPLITSPFWGRLHPQREALKTGPAWVELFLGKLKKVSGND
ncbi:MAG: YkgJ family cysteine cluster protein, partial [Gammaproteobacteria bacterium]|nr:YkgJ family cysteine cluster protein [Gammaproteobacteria bacterium]